MFPILCYCVSKYKTLIIGMILYAYLEITGAFNTVNSFRTHKTRGRGYVILKVMTRDIRDSFACVFAKFWKIAKNFDRTEVN